MSALQFFVVSYLVAGQDSQGQWLVKATDKRHAKKIVEEIDEDYVKIAVQSKEEYLETDADQDEWDEMLEEHKEELEEHGSAQLWCGT